MNKEKLIEEVRRYNFLYDASDAKYADSNKRDQAWKSIAGVLSAPESDCKKIWTNLRESYRRAISKKRTKSGQGATSSKKWQFEEEMSFLLPHIKQRKTVSSLIDDDCDNEQDSDINEINDILLSDNDTQISTNTEQDTIINRPESSDSTNTTTHSPLFPNIVKRKRRNNTQNNISASAELMKYLVQNKKEENKEDDVDKFFLSIAATVKKLNVYNQSVLKSRIFNMVSEVELQEIQQQHCYYGGSTGYNSHIEEPTGYNTQNERPSSFPAPHVNNTRIDNAEVAGNNASVSEISELPNSFQSAKSDD